MSEILISYDAIEKAAKKRIIQAGEKTSNPILKKRAQNIKQKESPTVRENIRIAQMLFDESVNMYREGLLSSFEDFVKDLTEALNAMINSKPKPPKSK